MVKDSEFKKKIRGYISKYPVFISYSSKDEDKQIAIDRLFKKYGAITFSAPKNVEPGAHFKKVIQSNIKSCSLFVPLISKNSLKSPYTQQEIGYAERIPKKDMLPIVLDDKIKESQLAFLSDRQYVLYKDKEKLISSIKLKIWKEYWTTCAKYIAFAAATTAAIQIIIRYL